MAKGNEVRGLRCSDTAHEAAIKIIWTRFDAFWAELPGVRSGNVESIHDMRVASRRLRTAMRAFRTCFPRKSFQKYEDSIREVTQSLGEVRDRDVLLGELHADQELLLPEQQPRLLVLIAHVERERDQQFDALEKRLKRLDHKAFNREFLSYLARQEQKGRDCSQTSLRSMGRKALRKEIKNLLQLREAIAGPEDSDALHHLRLGAKRLRYAFETFAVCWPEKAPGYADEIRQLQDVLGRLHDLDVLRSLLEAQLSPEAEQQHVAGLPEEEQSVPADVGILRLVAAAAREREEQYEKYSELWSSWENTGLLHDMRELVG